MKKESKRQNSFKLFWNAIKGSGRDIWTSLQVILAITIALAVVFYFCEHSAQPEEYGFFQSIWWAVLRYIGDPGKFAQVAPVTLGGRIIAMLIGILGILIFAIPAGVIGARFRKAIDDDKRKCELEDYRKRMKKSFRRFANRSLRTYLDALPDKGGEKFKKLNFVPSSRTISRMQVRQSLDIKDVMDVCHEFSEFRLKNLAQAVPTEEEPADRLVVEHFPINTEYGCCINRGSKVTIFSTSSQAELGIGWFTYYLAKFGGFNYISKDIEVDPDEFDSFFNIDDEPLCDKKKKSEWKETINGETVKENNSFNVLTSVDEALKIIEQKEMSRKDFFEHINGLLNGNDSWLISINAIDKTQENPNDFVFTDMTRDKKLSSIIDEEAYKGLYETLSCILKKELELESSLRPQRYPLLKKNIAFFLREKQGFNGNAFTLRLSSKLINLDSRKLIVAYLMAKTISERLDDNRGMQDFDVKDFGMTGFGYQLPENALPKNNNN